MKTTDPQSSDAASQIIRELLLQDRNALSASAAKQVGGFADAALEPLLAILANAALRNPEGPGWGWGPVHAAQLLGQYFPDQAVEPLLDVLATTAPLTALRQATSTVLSGLGRRLIAPILARLPTAVGDYREELHFLLAGVGVRDQRVFDVLLSALAENTEKGAMWLGEYGDPAALPHLSRTLDENPGLPEGFVGVDSTVFELREAIEGLGGTLTEAQQSKYVNVLWARRVEVEVESRIRNGTGPGNGGLA